MSEIPFGNTLRTRAAADSTPAPKPRTPGRRRPKGVPFVVGSDTSEQAAESVRERAVDLETEVYNYFAQPLTSDDVETMSGLPHQTVSARIRSLVQKGLLVDSGRKRMTRHGRNAKLWMRPDSPPPTETNRGKGSVRVNGPVIGHVEKGVFTATKKDLKHDLWLRGAMIRPSDAEMTPAEALRSGLGMWVLDLGAMEALRDKGVGIVEIPTHQGPRFRTTMGILLGHNGFDITTADRVQVALELKYWTRLE